MAEQQKIPVSDPNAFLTQMLTLAQQYDKKSSTIGSPGARANIDNLLGGAVNRANSGDFSKASAFADTDALVAQIFKQMSETQLPQIYQAQATTGGYNSSTAQLLGNDAFARAVAQATAAKTDTAAKYAAAQAAQTNAAANAGNTARTSASSSQSASPASKILAAANIAGKVAPYLKGTKLPGLGGGDKAIDFTAGSPLEATVQAGGLGPLTDVGQNLGIGGGVTPGFSYDLGSTNPAALVESIMSNPNFGGAAEGVGSVGDFFRTGPSTSGLDFGNLQNAAGEPGVSGFLSGSSGASDAFNFGNAAGATSSGFDISSGITGSGDSIFGALGGAGNAASIFGENPFSFGGSLATDSAATAADVAGASFSNFVPYLGALFKLAQGDVRGAVGTAIGTAILPGIGTAIGAILGSLASSAAGGKTPAEPKGYSVDGSFSNKGFDGSWFGYSANAKELFKFPLQPGDGQNLELEREYGDLFSKLPDGVVVPYKQNFKYQPDTEFREKIGSDIQGWLDQYNALNTVDPDALPNYTPGDLGSPTIV